MGRGEGDCKREEAIPNIKHHYNQEFTDHSEQQGSSFSDSHLLACC